MARRRFERPVEEAEINITPMLDMVFIMLIFFIVTTSFIHVSGLGVSQPSQSQNKVVKQSEIVLIQIADDGTIEVDYKQSQRKVDIDEVRPEVEKDLAAAPNAQVVVAASPGSQAGTLVEVIDQARQAGARKVSLATTET
jgi:biopolymer transport protein ExbD